VVWIAFVLYWRIKAANTKTDQRLEPAASQILRALTDGNSSSNPKGPDARRQELAVEPGQRDANPEVLNGGAGLSCGDARSFFSRSIAISVARTTTLNS
jgi:hypothetical protein